MPPLIWNFQSLRQCCLCRGLVQCGNRRCLDRWVYVWLQKDDQLLHYTEYGLFDGPDEKEELNTVDVCPGCWGKQGEKLDQANYQFIKDCFPRR